MPIPLAALAGFLLKTIASVLVFYAVDRVITNLMEGKEEEAMNEAIAPLVGAGLIYSGQEALLKKVVNTIPTPPAITSTGAVADMIEAVTQTGKATAVAGTMNPTVEKKLFAEISKLKTALRKGGMKVGLGKVFLISFVGMLPWLPQLIQNILDQGVFNSYQSNRILDALGVPEKWRWPEDPAQVTPLGLKDMQFRELFDLLTSRGISEINDPYKDQRVPFKAKNLADLITAIFLDRSARGLTVWPNELLQEAQKAMITREGVELVLPAAAAPAPTPEEIARITERITTKPKLFVGTIFAGKIAPLSTFTRQIDDEVTSDQDLLNDAEINLSRWLAHLPGHLTFEIQTKQNPFDEQNVRRPGLWAVLAIFVTTKYNKSVFLDEILLGPINPLVYYPVSQRVVEVQATLSDFSKVIDILPDEYQPLIGVPPGFTKELVLGPAPLAGAPTGPIIPAAPAPTPAPAIYMAQEGDIRVNPNTGKYELYNPEGQWVEITPEQATQQIALGAKRVAYQPTPGPTLGAGGVEITPQLEIPEIIPPVITKQPTGELQVTLTNPPFAGVPKIVFNLEIPPDGSAFTEPKAGNPNYAVLYREGNTLFLVAPNSAKIEGDHIKIPGKEGFWNPASAEINYTTEQDLGGGLRQYNLGDTRQVLQRIYNTKVKYGPILKASEVLTRSKAFISTERF